MSGDSYTQWSAEVLEQLAGDLDKAHKTIVAEFDDMETRLESNLADWQGEARMAYQDAKRQWNQKQEEMNDILHKFQQAVRQIHQQYGDTESRNQSMWA